MALRNILREHRLAIIFLAVFLVLDLFLLAVPSFPVFDEIIYIPVAYNMMRLTPQPLQPTILGAPITVGAAFNLTRYYPYRPLGVDYNVEQPPLAKFIIGVSLYAFSPNVTSYLWARVPSVIMSIIALISMYGIGLVLFKSKRWALLSMVFLNFDTLFWVHSRIALPDIYQLAFMMVGILLYLKNHKCVSMGFFALSILSKLTGIFGLVAVIIYDVVTRRSKKVIASNMLYAGLCFALTFIGYAVLVQFFGMSQNPVTNFFYYVKWVKGASWTFALVTSNPPVSQPWNWLFNQQPVRYAWIFDPTTSYPIISIWGQLNPALIFFTIPVLFWTGYMMVTERDTTATLLFIWFMATWLPYFGLSLFGQEQFIHHFLSTVPCLSLAIVNWLRTQHRVFTVGFTVFLLLGWFMAYPYPFLWLYLSGVSPFGPLPPLNFLFG